MKYKRAIFCWLILRFDSGLHRWLLLLGESRKSASLLNIDANRREWIADWAVNTFLGQTDFDNIIRVLAGDDYFERNKRDIAKLEKETGKSIFDLWDTDPVFEKYPRLKTLARNLEFEKMWKQKKQKVK